MKYVIIPEDKLVIVDGVPLNFDFKIDSGILAVRWDDEQQKVKGRIEKAQGLDETFDDPAQFQDNIDQHVLALKHQVKNARKAEKEFNLLKNIAKREIEALEAQITPRRMREAMLTEDGKVWLEGIESQIDTLRGKL